MGCGQESWRTHDPFAFGSSWLDQAEPGPSPTAALACHLPLPVLLPGLAFSKQHISINPVLTGSVEGRRAGWKPGVWPCLYNTFPHSQLLTGQYVLQPQCRPAVPSRDPQQSQRRDGSEARETESLPGPRGGWKLLPQERREECSHVLIRKVSLVGKDLERKSVLVGWTWYFPFHDFLRMPFPSPNTHTQSP